MLFRVCLADIFDDTRNTIACRDRHPSVRPKRRTFLISGGRTVVFAGYDRQTIGHAPAGVRLSPVDLHRRVPR